mmetsp:Transcript_33847/g.34482  ORF Transcript_33847/g.34482 Transcript_33847/m.34482 type:complete len:117 (+) Transcript_33847:133-483(+)|eukprot:CAMPEP_0182417262 /NCGR_PEP_ID=MMETSP1167-20130531/1694_1 /TAXON_ID=2988 /ORGANISM="Mallomonas Sp, Strain CCMP3275" /LENGTH=116 /DNA_ID=CAMNT_0024590681 /DNA_START=121 /DNA_END=471 /DNA_ORIENTATION=+
MSSRKIQIQVGVCKRMVKEVKSYEKEVVENEAVVKKMRDEGRDPYDIRKQEEVLQESCMMIPDSKRRYEAAIETLKSHIEEFGDETDAALLTEAKEIVAEFEATNAEREEKAGDGN